MKVVDSDQGPRSTVAPSADMIVKLVFSGPPQRSDADALGSAEPAAAGSDCGAMQPVLSLGPLPRRTLVWMFLVNSDDAISSRPQRLPLASGAPNWEGRDAAPPTPKPVRRWAYLLS